MCSGTSIEPDIEFKVDRESQLVYLLLLHMPVGNWHFNIISKKYWMYLNYLGGSLWVSLRRIAMGRSTLRRVTSDGFLRFPSFQLFASKKSPASVKMNHNMLNLLWGVIWTISEGSANTFPQEGLLRGLTDSGGLLRRFPQNLQNQMFPPRWSLRLRSNLL